MSTEDNANQTEFSISDRNTQIKRKKAVDMNCFTHLGKLNLEIFAADFFNVSVRTLERYLQQG
ncbi:hypothetical protein ACWATR_22915 [Nostoc sp. UIC 10890]